MRVRTPVRLGCQPSPHAGPPARPEPCFQSRLGLLQYGPHEGTCGTLPVSWSRPRFANESERVTRRDCLENQPRLKRSAERDRQNVLSRIRLKSWFETPASPSITPEKAPSINSTTAH